MKITYKGDYALKAILDLSYNFREGNAVPLADISKRQNIPEKYLFSSAPVTFPVNAASAADFICRNPPKN